MTERLLLCVDSSPAALQAARIGLEMAGRHGGTIDALFVVESGDSGGGGRGTSLEGRHTEEEGRALLERVEALAHEQHCDIEVNLVHGDPLRSILAEAERFQPDLIFMGRGRRRGPGSPVVGGITAHILEFSRWPVVVVPEDIRSSRSPRPRQTVL